MVASACKESYVYTSANAARAASGKIFREDVKLLNPRQAWITTGRRLIRIYMLYTMFLLHSERPKHLDNPLSG